MDNDCDGVVPTEEQDGDGDGYVECSVDLTSGKDRRLTAEKTVMIQIRCCNKNKSGSTMVMQMAMVRPATLWSRVHNRKGTYDDSDCDDANPLLMSINDDADCDGVLEADDCDDTDPTSTTVATDADCDGVLESDDCDDTDPSSTVVAEDADCDGTLTDDDCDDNDGGSTIVMDDADCDGTITFYDCDDTDPTLNEVDLDGDGNSTCFGDCDDSNPSVSGLQGGGCPMGASCLDILGVYDVGDDVYTIDPSGGGVLRHTMCTVTRQLMEEVDCVGQSTNVSGLDYLHPNVSESATHLSGAGTCYPTNELTMEMAGMPSVDMPVVLYGSVQSLLDQ